MLINRGNCFTFLLFCTVLALTSCNTSKFLAEDEYLLEKNNIKFQGKEKIKNKGTLKYNLASFYKQRPNGNFLFAPREWFYFKTEAKEDPSKFRRWQQRVLGEPPSIYDEELASATSEAMQYFLEYKGYFNASVVNDHYYKRHKAFVNYYIHTGPLFLIDSVTFSSQDTLVERLINEVSEATYLKKNEGLEGELFELEKERISQYLRNNGYAYFYSNYIAPLEADTNVVSKKARLYFEVLPPPGEEKHTQYHVGKISVFPQYDPTLDESILPDTLINNIHFRGDSTGFPVRPQAIVNAIYLQEGQLYRESVYNQTNRRLSALGVFRFVRIKYEPSAQDSSILDFRIELTSNPKLELGIDFELNYTNRSTSSAAADLLGISLSPSLKNRNLFNGAELLISNLSAGVEVNPSSRNDARFWNTIDLNLQTDLYFPKFLDYLGIWRRLNRIKTGKNSRLVGNGFYRSMEESAATRLRASYNFLLLLDFYQYNFFNASFGYDIQKSSTDRYLINHLAIDYLRPETQPDFDRILDSNPFLERSFGEQLFVSILFRDINYVKRSRISRSGESYFLGTSVEIAGAEIFAGNALYNAIRSTKDTLTLGNVNFAQYAKFDFDLRYYKQTSPQSTLAARFNIGIARPYGFATDVPYVKQFFVGGPNSIRAWAARGLGPGGYIDSLTVNSNNRLLFYQTGDLKIEFNLEYRFDLLWRLKGALFLDGGNVWTLRRDPNRCGSQFLLSRRSEMNCADQPGAGDPFYKQIALGAGFGFRFDFTYFIFRLDLGLPLRSPFPTPPDPEDIREWDYWYDFSSFKLRDFNFNIGLGYPF
jgi:outer membrane protein insertion porin family